MNIHILEKLDDEEWEILNRNFIKKNSVKTTEVIGLFEKFFGEENDKIEPKNEELTPF